MSELGSFLVVLRGGKHDGNSTGLVADGVRRLLTPSDAPGLLRTSFYEPIEELTHLRGNDRRRSGRWSARSRSTST